MAAMEYEVRDEYKSYTVAQLLEAPVNCFQGVGDTQSEILQRYFNVTTVQDLAQLPAFLQALDVQETVLEGGSIVEQPVSEVARQRQLGFQLRPADQAKRLSELPDAPVHVLENLTPGQDLALYDAFRITNLTQLAHNRIMLEARVIQYLAGSGGAAGGGASGGDAVASILGARAAAASAASERATSGDYSAGNRMQHLAGEVTEHVRDRLSALRDRAWDRAGSARGSSAGGVNRLANIRDGRERTTIAGRPDQQQRRGPLSRTEQITASRSGVAGREAARSVSDVRRDAGVSRTGGVAGGGGGPSLSSRPTTVRRPTSSTGGAMVRTRPSSGKAGGAEAAEGAAAAAGGAAGATTAAGAAGAEGTAAPKRTVRRRQPNPGPIILAAIILLLLLAGLIWFLVSRSGGDGTPTMAGSEQSQQGSATTTGTDASGSSGAQPGAPGSGTAGTAGSSGTGGAAGSQGAAGAQGTAGGASGAAGSTGQAGIKGTHTVSRGDTLWFISEKQYADPLNWPSIFMENKDQIRNPDLIFPDQKMRIPATPSYRFPDYPQGYTPSR